MLHIKDSDHLCPHAAGANGVLWCDLPKQCAEIIQWKARLGRAFRMFLRFGAALLFERTHLLPQGSRLDLEAISFLLAPHQQVPIGLQLIRQLVQGLLCAFPLADLLLVPLPHLR